jgi:hypothetical protein
MLPTYNDVKIICANNESFKIKHQTFGNTTVAQCTYFLASTGDFFPTVIELEENGKTISVYGDVEFNGTKLKNMTDTEIEIIGFDTLSQFAFGQ